MVGPYDLESASYFADPYETYARMPRDDPAYFDQARGIWFLTRYEDVQAVCRDKRMSVARADLFFAGVSPAMSEKTDVVRHFLTDWLNFVDPPRHARLRKLQTPAFSARKIAALESYIQQVVDRVLDALAGTGQFDLIHDFSFPVPAQVIAHMLGVPPEDLGSFKGWTDDVFRMLAWSGDPDENVAVAYDGVASLTAYFRDLIRARRKDPAEMRGDLVLPDYGYPRRWVTPSSSKACRWTGVGVVMMVKAGRSPTGWTRLAAMVARSASKVAKLCTGPPLGVALVAALAAAGASALDTTRRSLRCTCHGTQHTTIVR